MSIRMWAYEPEKCDGDYCPCDCYKCPKANEGDNFPIEAAMAALNMTWEDVLKGMGGSKE